MRGPSWELFQLLGVGVFECYDPAARGSSLQCDNLSVSLRQRKNGNCPAAGA
jgi:hypothetical protein